MAERARFHITQWDPKLMQQGRILVLVGARNTGKSVCQLDLLRHMASKVVFGFGMCPTLTTVQKWRTIMPMSWIYNDFDNERVESIVTAQNKRLQEGKTPPSIFLVMDDCSFNKDVMKSRAMRQIAMNGRHLGIHLNFACQSLMDLPPWMRANIDYLVCTSDKIITNKAKLWKHCFGLFEKYDEFSATFDACTQNFSCCVLDNTVRSQKVSECVFWWRAELNPGKFKMGSLQYRKLARKFERGLAQCAATAQASPPAAKDPEAEREVAPRVEVATRKKKARDIVAIDDGSGNLLSSTAETAAAKGAIDEQLHTEDAKVCPRVHLAVGDGLGFVSGLGLSHTQPS
jgi:hypothetical protein